MEQNKVLKIAISSILCYLIFKRSYSILTSLLLWMSVEMRMENEIVLFALNIVCGIISFFILIFVYNRFLKSRIPLKSEILTLLCVAVFLFLITAGINWLYGNYLAEIELDKYGTKHLSQYVWSNAMSSIFPIFVLGYFMWRFYMDKTTVSKKHKNK